MLSPRLPQSKSYLKITGLPYLQSDGNKITSKNVVEFMKHIDLFKDISLAAKPRVIKASPKSDMSIIWFDIWDTQNGSKAKLLINHSFNLGRHIATVRATNMNPGVPQCHNCWKWGHSTFSCKAHGSQCQKCSGPHKLEHHRDLAWCCKANPKLNPPPTRNHPRLALPPLLQIHQLQRGLLRRRLQMSFLEKSLQQRLAFKKDSGGLENQGQFNSPSCRR